MAQKITTLTTEQKHKIFKSNIAFSVVIDLVIAVCKLCLQRLLFEYWEVLIGSVILDGN